MKTSAQIFFESYASALLSFSAEKISEFYQVPFTLYSDQGNKQITKHSEITDFWKEGVKPYEAQGIQKTEHELINEEQLSLTIFICKVLWKNYNHSGKQVGEETNFYILSQNNGELKISGLIIMTH
jgi:hypothetical protein